MIHEDNFNYEKQKAFWIRKWQKRYESKLVRVGEAETVRIVTDFKKLRIDFKSFLELGCGIGRNIFIFHRTFPEVSYTGIDISPMMKKSVRKRYSEILKYANLFTVDVLTFLKEQELNSYDIVFTYGLLLHITEDVIDEVTKLMEECAAKAVVIYERENPRRECFWRIPRDYEHYFSLPCILKKPYTSLNTLWIFKK